LTPVPGNIDLSDSEKAARLRDVFQPYHARIQAEFERRRQAGRPVALISMHSFTPAYQGVARPWHAGVLTQRDRRLADLLLPLLRREAGLVVGDNEPYDVTDATDYTIPVHGERRGLPHVAIEIRQDLIADADGQRAWSARLARLLPQAYRKFTEALGPACGNVPR
jgi:predicted N-formylglutamate amidohydrolase